MELDYYGYSNCFIPNNSIFYLSFSGGSVLTCDFEQGFCQWFHLVDDEFDWTRNKGQTNSSGTGPTADHTKGTGEFLRYPPNPRKRAHHLIDQTYDAPQRLVISLRRNQRLGQKVYSIIRCL